MQLSDQAATLPVPRAVEYVRGEPIATPVRGSYEDFLQSLLMLGRGFGYRELVRPGFSDLRGRFRMPPRELWHRMVPTMAVANDLRRALCESVLEDRPTGLRIAAAYRPLGGASRSQHKFNAALDLDLLPAERRFANLYYRAAVTLWCEYGRELDMGLGLYCSPRSKGGLRIHIDTGARCRTWQISGGRSLRPYVHLGRPQPLAVELAVELGLTPPFASV